MILAVQVKLTGRSGTRSSGASGVSSASVQSGCPGNASRKSQAPCFSQGDGSPNSVWFLAHLMQAGVEAAATDPIWAAARKTLSPASRRHHIFKKERSFADKRPAPTGGPRRSSVPEFGPPTDIFFAHELFGNGPNRRFCIETLIGNRRAQFLKPVFPCGPGPSRDHPKQAVLVMSRPARKEEDRKGKTGIPKYRIRASGELCTLGIESQTRCTERLAHATDTVPGGQDRCGGKC